MVRWAVIGLGIWWYRMVYGNRLRPITIHHHYSFRAVGSLVVRAPDSGPEGLGSMPVPPNTLRVHAEYMLVKSVGPKVLWAESRVQGTGEKFPSSSVPCLNCGGGNRWGRHLS
ncbi:uncharacterized protein TNCV_487721 [Trichonephila clavipes]|nr:uncharacterized protein TNCV_487721 [Trichonephila clavipes]